MNTPIAQQIENVSNEQLINDGYKQVTYKELMVIISRLSHLVV